MVFPELVRLLALLLYSVLFLIHSTYHLLEDYTIFFVIYFVYC